MVLRPLEQKRFMKRGLSGTIYDYELKNNIEVSKNDADSTDSYAATFLSLTKSYLDASGDRPWVLNHIEELKTVANVIWATYDPDLHLTYAKPDWKIAYLMDNVEVWRGLKDYNELLGGINHPDSELYHYRAELIRNGTNYKLWNPQRNEYQFAYSSQNIDWGKFYPDVTANLWPMIFKLPEALLEDRRTLIYSKFKQNLLTKWINLQTDAFPWCSLYEVVKLNEAAGDADEILNIYSKNVMSKFYPRRQYTWTISDSSWFALLLNGINCTK